MKILGRHLIVELSDCNPTKLDDIDYLEEHMNTAVRKSGATIVRSVFHRYAPQGVSGVIVIAESHISIHTWPEYGYAAVDFFTCGEAVNPYLAYDYMMTALECRSGDINEIKRGIPSEQDQILDHKPASRANTPSMAKAD